MKTKRPLLFGIGPGIVMAATGAGAGDLIAASVAGAKYGYALLWAVVFGAAIKFAMSEGVARWQLVTGTTLLEAWVTRLPAWVTWYFLVYLWVWSFVVAGALIAACGLAGHALVPAVSVAQWGIIHSLLALVLVLSGRYRLLENLMKIFIALLFVVVLICAWLVRPEGFSWMLDLVWPQVPEGSLAFILGVIGGVGGSVTLMSYGYWMREKGWEGSESISQCRVDLLVAYGLTGLFGLSVMLITAQIQPEVVSGSGMALAVAEHLGTTTGPLGKWCFLIGFWAAVFSSMLGVWQGIPYLFTDFVQTIQAQRQKQAIAEIDTRSKWYRGYLCYLAVPPMLLLLAGKPVWLVVVYAVAAAFFMPLLAALLLYMNSRVDWLGEYRSRWPSKLFLVTALVVFAALLIRKLLTYFPS